ncbi:unnamed protein product, partial [Mesorhabditis spiculigera]
MSQIPISAAMIVGQQYGFDTPTSVQGRRNDRREVGHQPRRARKWALQSHERAKAAIAAGRFDNEIVAMGDATVDEGPRETSLEKMATLKVLVEDGRMTAAVASQISDGASALPLASAEAVEKYNLKPRARIHHLSARGDDPIFMLSAPIPATKHALAKAGLSIEDIDIVEINEAFAPVVLAWIKEIGADPAKVNVNGGAIALGHPLGATGNKLMATLLNELEGAPARL